MDKLYGIGQCPKCGGARTISRWGNADDELPRWWASCRECGWRPSMKMHRESVEAERDWLEVTAKERRKSFDLLYSKLACRTSAAESSDAAQQPAVSDERNTASYSGCSPRLAAFQSAFMALYVRFGLQRYRVEFQENELEGDDLATLTANSETCTALAQLNSKETSNSDSERGEVGAAGCGKHEAIHLLLAELHDLARSRWVREDELMAAEERVVNVLEREME